MSKSRYDHFNDPIESLIEGAGKTLEQAYADYRRQRQREYQEERRFAQMKEQIKREVIQEVLAAIRIEIKNEAGPVIQELNQQLKNLGK